MGNGHPGHVINYEDNYPNYQMPIQPPTYTDSSFFPTEFEHCWNHSSPGAPIPPNAIVGGHDSDGSVIYVGRSFHEGDHLPAKIVPSKGQAYVAWGGNEVNVHHYEILCGQNYNWVPCAMGRVPLNAVRSGTTSTGEPLYVGRGHHCGSLTVGKIHPTHHCLYIPFGGQEHRLDTYEVLVQDRGETWSRSAGSFIPPGAIHAGHDSDGSLIYVGRAYHAGELLPAKVVQNKGCAYVSHSGQEIQKYEYEILLSQGLTWVPSAGGHIPPNAVSGGHTAHNEPLYIGRGHHCGSLTPGKIHPSHRCLYIPYGGAEVRLDHYDVLVRSLLPFLIKPEPSAPCPTPMPTPTPPSVTPYPPIQNPIYPPPMQPIYPPPMQPIYPPPMQPIYPVPSSHTWIHSSPYAPIPTNAVHGGHDVDGSPMYIGRSYHEGDLLPAKVLPSKNIAFVSWNGQEFSKGHYEILCGYGYSWRPCHGGVIPPTAVRCGNASNEPLFIGRGHWESSLTVGKIHPSHRCLYIPFGGIERRLDHYEVLVQEATDIWIPCTDNRIPPNAVHAGTDSDLSSIYVGRAYHEGDLLPAKVVPTKGFAYVCFGGQEIVKHTYEILTGTYQWIPSQGGQIPPGAVNGGRSSAGETLYIGRGSYSGTMTPGKIQPSHHCLYIPFGGREVRIDNYEILVRPHNPLLPFY